MFSTSLWLKKHQEITHHESLTIACRRWLSKKKHQMRAWKLTSSASVMMTVRIWLDIVGSALWNLLQDQCTAHAVRPSKLRSIGHRHCSPMEAPDKRDQTKCVYHSHNLFKRHYLYIGWKHFKHFNISLLFCRSIAGKNYQTQKETRSSTHWHSQRQQQERWVQTKKKKIMYCCSSVL